MDKTRQSIGKEPLTTNRQLLNTRELWKEEPGAEYSVRNILNTQSDPEPFTRGEESSACF